MQKLGHSDVKHMQKLGHSDVKHMQKLGHWPNMIKNTSKRCATLIMREQLTLFIKLIEQLSRARFPCHSLRWLENYSYRINIGERALHMGPPSDTGERPLT
jgi:hypothetical protein